MIDKQDVMSVEEFRAILRGERPAGGGGVPSGNRKVRNAEKTAGGDGVVFDSRLEKYMHDLLTHSPDRYKVGKQLFLFLGKARPCSDTALSFQIFTSSSTPLP